MTRKNSLQILKNQLRHFGLNPDEWTMKAEGADRLLIIHREDQTLSFVGRANLRKARPQWQALALRSI